MKAKVLIFSLVLIASLFTGCTNKNEYTPETPKVTDNKTDTVTSPSRVTDEKNLLTAVKDSWIIILENDVSTDKEIILEGGFKRVDKDDSSKMIPTTRVLALYKNGTNKVKEATYTLTTPKLIIKDNATKIEGGVIKGDVYIEADKVVVEDTKIDGDIYFKNDETKKTFHMDEKSKCTGSMKMIE